MERRLTNSLSSVEPAIDTDLLLFDMPASRAALSGEPLDVLTEASLPWASHGLSIGIPEHYNSLTRRQLEELLKPVKPIDLTMPSLSRAEFGSDEDVAMAVHRYRQRVQVDRAQARYEAFGRWSERQAARGNLGPLAVLTEHGRKRLVQGLTDITAVGVDVGQESMAGVEGLVDIIGYSDYINFWNRQFGNPEFNKNAWRDLRPGGLRQQLGVLTDADVTSGDYALTRRLAGSAELAAVLHGAFKFLRPAKAVGGVGDAAKADDAVLKLADQSDAARKARAGTDEAAAAKKAEDAAAARSSGMSRGAQLRAKYGAQFGEYSRFRGQGFTPAQSKYLTQPYRGMGHHFVPRRHGLPSVISESPLNVMKPKGISIGRFYERHFLADPHFFAARFPRSVGGVWNGNAIGLQKPGLAGRLWYGSPGALKITAGAGAAAGGGALYWWLSSDEE